MKTVADARPVCNEFVKGGYSPGSDIVLKRINEAQERLLPYATDVHTLRRMRIITQNNTITMPREVQNIKGVVIDGQPKRSWNMAYEFVDGGPGEICQCGASAEQALQDLGEGYPTFYEIPVDQDELKPFFMSTEEDDVGKTITLRGYKPNGEQLWTDSAPGISLEINQWAEGVEGNINDTTLPGSSVSSIKQVVSVHKPVTKGYVYFGVYRASDSQIWTLGKYHPDETCPGYRRYKLLGPNLPETHGEDPEYAEYGNTILCLVKLKALELKHDTDTLLIQSLGALKNAVRAIEHENAREYDLSKNAFGMALRILGSQKSDKESRSNQLNIKTDREALIYDSSIQ
jgi:hypothetical protein